MSGGSMNYIYRRLLDDACFSTNTPERRAFMAHIKKVAEALKAIEWVDSGDCSPGDESDAIRECLPSGACLDKAIEIAQETIDALSAEIERAKHNI